MAFTPINTQEEFDAAIRDRLERERNSVSKKYEGFLSPEQVTEKYKNHLSPEQVAEQYKGWLSPEQAAEKDQKITRYETNSAKMRIAHESGLPFELADRLTGETEDDIRADAANLAKFMGAQRQEPAPFGNMEPPTGDDVNAGLREMLGALKGEN